MSDTPERECPCCHDTVAMKGGPDAKVVFCPSCCAMVAVDSDQYWAGTPVVEKSEEPKPWS